MSNRFSKLPVAALLAIIAVMAPAVTWSSCFVIEPYSVHVDHESAQVLWTTPGDAEPGTLHLMNDEKDTLQTFISETVVPPFRDRHDGDLDLIRHSVVIDDLEAYRSYHYEVVCAENDEKRSGRFKTTRIPGEAKPFEFIVMSDIHAQYGHHEPVAEALKDENPDFILHTGDFISHWGEYWSHWPEMFEVTRPYSKSTTFVPVVGNHDIEPAGNYRYLFGFENPELDRDEEDEAWTYFSYYFGNMHIIALDFHTQRRGLEPQLEWLENELENSSADWVIVTFHDSMISVAGREFYRRDILREFAQVIIEHEVDLAFFGHDHVYERLIPIGAEGKRPVNFISTNAGGHSRAVRPSPIVAGGIAYPGVMYSYLNVDDNRLEMEARLPDGTVLDSLVLEKDEDGMYQDEIMEQAISLEMAEEIAYIYAADHSNRDVRLDLRGEFGYVSSGDPNTEVLLNVSRFPQDSRLIITEQKDPSDWRSERQYIDITGDTAAAEIKMPENIKNISGRPIPSLQPEVNLEWNDRTFEPAVIKPNIEFPEMDVVELIHPRNLVRVSTRPEFTWEELAPETDYQLQLAVTNFSNPEDIRLDTVVTDTVFAYPPDSELKHDKIYYWRVRPAESGATTYNIVPWSNTGFFRADKTTSVTEGEDHPESISLEQNYPNPFNATTVINFYLPQDDEVVLEVFDVLGRHISTLVNERVQSGEHSVSFDASGLAGGVYKYRLRSGDFSKTRTMMLVK